MKRSVLLKVGMICATFATARGDEPPSGTVAGRVVEGRVVDDQGAPISGAMVLLGLADPPLPFTKEATTRTDAQGRYRIVLTSPRLASSRLRSLALAPGFKLARGTVVAGSGVATASFTLSPEPWKTTEVRLVDLSGRPLPGVELMCSIPLGVPWSELVTDAEGRCRVTMAIDQGCTLLGKPEGARPIDVYLANLKNDPAAVTVTLLPPIRGRVRDPDGRPLPDVVVGRMIYGENDRMKMLPHFLGSAITNTDGEGRFALAPTNSIAPDETKRPGEYRPPTTVCFADKDFTRFAFRLVDLSGPVEPLDVTLGRGRPVNIRVERGSAPTSPDVRDSLTLAIVDRPDIFKVGPHVWAKILNQGERSGNDSIKMALPADKYILAVESYDAKTLALLGQAERELVVGTGTELLDLPPLRIDATFHQKMVGKPAPEIETTDLDSGRPVHLADFKGNVVILDFWGYWCGPCVSSMPYLIELHRRFDGRPLAIVALHDQSVQSRSDYDRRIAQVRKELWDDRDLPFRVVLDRPDPAKPPERFPEGTGETCHRYGIETFPTLFVIDQNGTMVGEFHRTQHDTIEAIVRDLLEKPASR